jgi:hypothetical protein
MDRLQQELVASSVIGPRSAFDLRSVVQMVAAILLGLFLLGFLFAFLPWLLAGAMQSAVEGLMHRVGFSKFSADNIGDWILVFFIGLLAIIFFVIVITAIAAVANFLSARVSFRRFRSAAIQANTRIQLDDREPTAPINAGARASRPYEQRSVSELQAEARRRGIPGRSQMNKAQLIAALRNR